MFGVCCEALPSQLNYLIDEAGDVGKGANCTFLMKLGTLFCLMKKLKTWQHPNQQEFKQLREMVIAVKRTQMQHQLLQKEAGSRPVAKGVRP